MANEPLKVALVSRFPWDANHPRGGVEAVTVVLARSLAERPELDVHVVAFDDDAKRCGVRNVDGLTEHRIPTSRCPQVVDVVKGPGRRRLLRYLRGMRPDLVHVHETWGLGMGNFDIPTVFTIHGFDDENLKASAAPFAWVRVPLWRLVTKWGLSRLQNIVSITPYVTRAIEHETRARIYEIENPVDKRFFVRHPRPEPGRVLCVGWISERKNTLAAVRAFAAAALDNEGWRLIIAGEAKSSAYRAQVTACIDELGIADRVELSGHINHDRLVTELTKASVLLLPSRQENSPMAIAEAMAAGLPVIASNRCGMPYMIQERVTGILIDPDNTVQIGHELRALLLNETWRADMGRSARKEAERRFHPDSTAARTIEMYHDVLATSRRGRSAREGEPSFPQ